MRESLTSHGIDTHHKLLKIERGIAYFEGGWWMHEADMYESRRRLEEFLRVALKRNDETKQIEIDYTVYP